MRNIITNVRSGNTQLDIRDASFKHIIFPVLSIDTDPTGSVSIITDENGHAVLLDVTRSENLNALLAALSGAGVDTIDAIFISHWHTDHYENLTDLATYYDLSETKIYLARPSTLLPDSANLYAQFTAIYGDNAITPTNGSEYTHIGMKFTCYNCSDADISYYEANSTDYNDCSMIIYAEYLNNRYCYTADVATVAQQRCIDQGYIKPSQFVTVPHHGYNTSNVYSFIKDLAPEAGYISDSYVGVGRGLRDPAGSYIDSLGVVYDNMSNREKPVTVTFNGYGMFISGNATKVGAYAAEGVNVIYVDPTINAAAEQLGSVDKPFSSIRRAVSAATGYTQIQILNNDQETVSITAANGYIEIVGNNHIIASALTITAGGNVKISNGEITGNLYLRDSTIASSRITYAGQVILSNNCIYNSDSDTFSYNGGAIITAESSVISVTNPKCTNRSGLFIDAVKCFATGNFTLGNIQNVYPILKNVRGLSDFDRLIDSLNALRNVWDPAGAPLVMYDTTNNKLIHMLTDGTIKSFTPDA